MLQAKNKKLKLADIRIPRRFAESRPSPDKLNEKYRRYMETGVLDKVYVDEDMNLVDGYISFLIARMIGADGVLRGVVLIDRDKHNQKSAPEKEPAPEKDPAPEKEPAPAFTTERYESLLRRFERLAPGEDPYTNCRRGGFRECRGCILSVEHNGTGLSCLGLQLRNPKDVYAKLVAYFDGGGE